MPAASAASMPDRTPNAERRTPRGDSLAVGLLVAHFGLIAFSTIAMLTILNGPPSPFLAREPNATILRLGWAWSGPTYVVLGALAALAHAAGRLGPWRAAGLLAGATLISLGAELTGTSTGFPFGEYRYTPLLGYRVGGLVPFPIPISWFYMLYASLAMCGRWLPVTADSRTRWKWALLAGAVLLAWDVSMDPAMVQTAHWLWGSGERFRALGFPDWLVWFFSADLFYGMPLSNWFGWFLTGTLIARVMVAIAPPRQFTDQVSPSWIPVALYAANGVMPIALCLRDGLWWAAVLGAAAMAVPVGFAMKSERRNVGESEGRKGGKAEDGWDDAAHPA